MKKLRLTVREKRILKYPPTPNTWLCFNHEDEPRGLPNTGESQKCLWCGKAKPIKVRKPWSEYEKLCQKVGVPVGFMYKETTQGPMMREKGKSWQLIERKNGLE
jgi:hypothetical protein